MRFSALTFLFLGLFSVFFLFTLEREAGAYLPSEEVNAPVSGLHSDEPLSLDASQTSSLQASILPSADPLTLQLVEETVQNVQTQMQPQMQTQAQLPTPPATQAPAFEAQTPQSDAPAAAAIGNQADFTLEAPPSLSVEPVKPTSPSPSVKPTPKRTKSAESQNALEKLDPGNGRPVIIAAAESDAAAEETLKSTITSEEERAQLFEQLEKHSEILQAQANVVKLVAKIIDPSVVHIKSSMVKRGPNGQNFNFHDEGSGIIVLRNDCFYVLTNHHVIREALSENIEIHFSDNRMTHPNHVWYDEETDIAVLELSETDLTPATIGDSNTMDIGDFVLAVGSPFGLNRSVTFGIISAKGRRTINLDANVNLQDFLQTDAAINPGNSGGPLVNLRAEVIAMNTAIASNSGANAGIAFSIPIRMVMLVADQLILYGRARRAYLGVTLDPKFTAERAAQLGLPRAYGAYVTEVQPGSPAAQANFSIGDVIIKFNGVAVEDEKHLYNLVNLTELGKEIPVTVFRAGKIYKINIRLQER